MRRLVKNLSMTKPEIMRQRIVYLNYFLAFVKKKKEINTKYKTEFETMVVAHGTIFNSSFLTTPLDAVNMTSNKKKFNSEESGMVFTEGLSTPSKGCTRILEFRWNSRIF